MEQLRLVTAFNTDMVTIHPRPGINVRILEVWVDNPADRSYVDVAVGPHVVARFPVRWGDCLFFAPYKGSVKNQSFFTVLRKLFGEDIYVEADQSETVTFKFSAPQGAVHILYQLTGEAVDKTKPLRSAQTVTPLFLILSHSAAINATRNYSLDTVSVPIGFVGFRDGDTIPAGCQFTIKALAFGSAAVEGTKPTYFHLWRREFEILTPEDHKGVSVDPNSNLLVWDVNTDDYFTLPEFALTAGEKVTVNFDAVHDGRNDIAAGTLAAFIVTLFSRLR